MGDLVSSFNSAVSTLNTYIWHEYVLYFVIGVGVMFLIWSLCQFRGNFPPYVAFTHGIAVLGGKYDHKDAPGAINHFQAVSASLSSTIGLGNIGGVAVAITLGGPGAVFWMWVVGFVGMALKMIEVIQALIYRDTKDPNNPHGGPMWVAAKGVAEFSPRLAWVGKVIGSIYCLTLLIATITGGNMFQAWSVGDITLQNFGVPNIISGLVMAALCAMVIIGGIKRIGQVAGALVPFMCLLYIVASLAVLIYKIDQIPSIFSLIIKSAFSPAEAQGAFLGAAAGTAFIWGMKRAFFSNESGQGCSPIAHSAAKTDEPVREGVVAALEPFIDTLIICTMTALVILATGAWNRSETVSLPEVPEFYEHHDNLWSADPTPLPAIEESSFERWQDGQVVFMVGEGQERSKKVFGKVIHQDGNPYVAWELVSSEEKPQLSSPSLYIDYMSASLTSYAFDSVFNGFGRWIITFLVWLFAMTTMISWSYYGEQSVVYLFGERFVFFYKIVYCTLIIVATSGIISKEDELDNLTGMGTGLMLLANIPIILIFAPQAMRAYKDYLARLRAGEFKVGK